MHPMMPASSFDSISIPATALNDPLEKTSRTQPSPVELQSAGLKVTPHRLKVLEIFQNTTARHMSAEDVFRVLIAENSDIGLATVYRVLSQFESAGILRRHHFEHGKAVFELKGAKRHFHLVCLGCGSVVEFFDAEMELRQREVAAQFGFEVRDETLAIYGTCAQAECRASQVRTE